MAEITEKSFPFDSDDVNGEPDRTYLAEDFARYFSAFITSGTFMKESTNLQVIENGDMTVTLKPGRMIIDGYRYDNVGDIIIPLDPADGVLNRIDRISVTWSKEDNDIHYTLQKGTPSYEPIPHGCRRNDDTKDYVIADVYVRAGAVYITQADITDQRLNTEICGIANPFKDIDTSTIFNQFTGWLKITKEKGEADVTALIEDMNNYLETLEVSGDNRVDEINNKIWAWFNNMKDQLSEDSACKLQIEIDELQEQVGLIETPDFNDTGEIEGVNSFADFMTSFVKNTSIYQLLANLKAGLKYVLHAGQLVNNGTCKTPGKFPLDAAYGNTLTDMVIEINNKLADGISVRYNAETDYVQIYNGEQWFNWERGRLLELDLLNAADYPWQKTSGPSAAFVRWVDAALELYTVNDDAYFKTVASIDLTGWDILRITGRYIAYSAAAPMYIYIVSNISNTTLKTFEIKSPSEVWTEFDKTINISDINEECYLKVRMLGYSGQRTNAYISNLSLQ